PKSKVIYMNAYPDKSWGYNDLPDTRSQEELLRKVMMRMEQWRPELCLIACNTLSIIWQHLEKWWCPSFPVRGIIEAAVEQMSEYMESHPESELLVLGTKSTIASNVYPKALIASGIEKSRIHSMPCHRLATLIEQDPSANAVRERIAEYADQAAGLFETRPKRLALGFCCTHYGYARDFWQAEFSRRFGEVDVLNPNEAMVCPGRGVAFEYHSKLELSDGQRRAMAAVFANSASPIAKALQGASAELDLF
ncbi:MAG: aspartate/glutamate racemase family protein, partial [Victivallales bacterium]|nr:aspartate/glutamate racemase family protein [Victivallales bacterium]